MLKAASPRCLEWEPTGLPEKLPRTSEEATNGRREVSERKQGEDRQQRAQQTEVPLCPDH